MQYSIFKIIALVLLISVSYSCTKQETEYIEVHPTSNADSLLNPIDNIVGEWQWIKTVIVDRGGGGINTPESCNCTRYIKVNDKEISDYRDDVLYKKSKYEIKEIKFVDDDRYLEYQFNSESLYGRIRMTNTTLGIGPFGGCGAIYYFKRL